MNRNDLRHAHKAAGPTMSRLATMIRKPEPQRKLKNAPLKKPFTTGLFSLLLMLASASHAQAAPPENSIKLSPEHTKNLGVILGKLTPVEQIPVLYAPAKVVIPPEHEYLVTASQAGLITKLNVAIGDRVKKGAVLAQLNSPDLLSMQRLYLKSESELQLGLLSYQRDKKLLEDGVIAERRWQETRSQYQAFASEASEHRQLLSIGGMSDEEIDQLKRTHRLSGQLNVHAPISGVVIDRMAVAGSRVDILAPLYRIADLSELWLEINIPQERIADISLGDRVMVEPIGGVQEQEPQKITATISQLGAAVHPDNQTVLARAVINGRTSAVRSGQRINVQILHVTEKPAFKIPNAAIAQNEGKSYVFIRDKDGFEIRPVAVIGKEGEETIVSGDFSGDEDIAIKGAVALKANWLGLGSEE